MTRRRMNIELEDAHVNEIMRGCGLRTTQEAVDLALRHLAGQPMSRQEALAMEGAHAIGGIPPDTGPADSG